MELPLEILYKICEVGNMKSTMSFLLSAKRVNKYFNKQERFIIRKTLHNLESRIYRYEKNSWVNIKNHVKSLQLDKWIVEPFHLSSHELVPKILKYIKEKNYDKVFPETYFITGGAITQIAFNTSWESDVDIFVAQDKKEKNEEKREKKIINGIEYDFITKNVSSPEKVLRRFDISLCQIGVLVSPSERKLKVYVTPLFLCSYNHKIMPIQVSDISCSYLIDNDTCFVESLFEKHILHNKYIYEGDFVDCSVCSAYDHGENTRYKRWNERVNKYKSRFPEFPTSYYFSSKM